VAPTSYAKLEQAAGELWPLLPKQAASSYIIDAQRLLERTLPQAGFEPHVAEIKELEDCAGFAIPEQGLVVLRHDVYEGLFKDSVFSRSTVVHELAHIALAHHVTLHRGATLGQHRFFEDSEWQANAMMAALMMPLEACNKARNAHELAEMCGTSVEAARYRLQRLEEKEIIPKRR